MVRLRAIGPGALNESTEEPALDFLQPYFATVGFAEPPQLTVARFNSAGWVVPTSKAEAEQTADSTRSSGLFDSEGYAARAGLAPELDPAMHYVIVGERMGYAPSARFDPAYYRARYPELVNVSNYLDHYQRRGRDEGRQPISLASQLHIDVSRIDPNKPTVLMIAADGADQSRLACDIAGRLAEKYNIVMQQLRGDSCSDELKRVCAAVVGPIDADYDEIEIDRLVRRLIDSFDIYYAIALSIDCRDLLPPLTIQMVPVVTLADEPASSAKPEGAKGRALEWSTEIVFADENISHAMDEEYGGASNGRHVGLGRPRAFRQETRALDSYAATIDEIGHKAVSTIRQTREDFETIRNDPTFDLDGYLAGKFAEVTRDTGVRHVLARAAALGAASYRSTETFHRRPSAGFHPQIYAHERGKVLALGNANPLAHYIRTGKPDGPWRHDVIPLPALPFAGSVAPNKRIAVHGHFYYPELASDFLRRLEKNSCSCDLLVSTDDAGKADVLREVFRKYERGQTTVCVVRNRGRDIGPFLTEFEKEILDRYDLVGHLHAKKSLHIGAVDGEAWREFLWEHLLGGIYPMMDIVVDHLFRHENVGLVFPEEWDLPDWGLNWNLATELAGRMDIATPLPPFFDFPAGTMFWARPAALKPLFDLRLALDTYPAEPVGIDGTLLHAIERLLPFVARRAGFRYATTYVPGVCR